MLNELQK